MKKSRIIIPALAMIAFSVAASITGTVAWFTANRTASINAGTYAVIKTTSDLQVEVVGGFGTTASNNVVTVGGDLTDGSFSHLTNTIYAPNEAGTAISTSAKGAVALGSATEALLTRGTTGTGSSARNIYTAVTFNVEFTITFGGSNTDVALFMDNTDGMTSFSTTGEAKTAKGFRMAFVPASRSGDAFTPAASSTVANPRVLADLQTAANCKHINASNADLTDATTHGGIAYSSPALIDSAYNTALPTDPAVLTTYQARADYLGYFANASKDSNNQVKLAYIVVCWFEGTDPEIINRQQADFQSVSANLCFEAKDILAA